MKKSVIIYKNGIKKCRCECLKIKDCFVIHGMSLMVDVR